MLAGTHRSILLLHRFSHRSRNQLFSVSSSSSSSSSITAPGGVGRTTATTGRTGSWIGSAFLLEGGGGSVRRGFSTPTDAEIEELARKRADLEKRRAKFKAQEEKKRHRREPWFLRWWNSWGPSRTVENSKDMARYHRLQKLKKERPEAYQRYLKMWNSITGQERTELMENPEEALKRAVQNPPKLPYCPPFVEIKETDTIMDVFIAQYNAVADYDETSINFVLWQTAFVTVLAWKFNPVFYFVEDPHWIVEYGTAIWLGGLSFFPLLRARERALWRQYGSPEAYHYEKKLQEEFDKMRRREEEIDREAWEKGGGEDQPRW